MVFMRSFSKELPCAESIISEDLAYALESSKKGKTGY